MKQVFAALAVSVLLIFSCQDMETVTVAPDPFVITPSRPPIIITLTPILFQPTISATPPPTFSLTPSSTTGTSVAASETFTPSPTSTVTYTPSPASTETFTPSPTITHTPQLPVIQLLGCDTGIDVTHGMGEVTNAYVTIINAPGPDLTSVCTTLSSADEGRIHPDKTICIPSLPRGYLVTLKLTIDTTFRVSTIIDLVVTSTEGISISQTGLACQAIGALLPVPEIMNIPQPIP